MTMEQAATYRCAFPNSCTTRACLAPRRRTPARKPSAPSWRQSSGKRAWYGRTRCSARPGETAWILPCSVES